MCASCPLYNFRENNTDFTRVFCDNVMGPQVFDAIDQDTAALGSASMLTEWGMCDPTLPDGVIECDSVQSHADAHLQSWAWWDYAGLECYNSSGAPIPEYVAMMSRTYAKAIAGVPQNMSFDRVSGAFSLCYTLATGNPGAWSGSPEDVPVAQTTEIYYHSASFYPRGVKLWTTPNVNASVADNITIAVVPASLSSSGVACVNVTAL